MIGAILDVIALVGWSILLLISIMANKDNELRGIAIIGCSLIVFQVTLRIIEAMVG